MEEKRPNVDAGEVARFSRQAARWWDKKGPLAVLHDINPLRVGYIRKRSGIKGKTILDAGCGGGILSEALAGAGARVTGIDISGEALAAARRHARASGLAVDYLQATPETLAAQRPNRFDVVACMELLEHVPDPVPVVQACAALAKPGGDVFFSTISRTPLAYLLVILAAERVLGLAEKGTHSYERFIRPGELVKWADACGLVLSDCSGLAYLPFVRKARLTRGTRMNYLMHLKKPLPEHW